MKKDEVTLKDLSEAIKGMAKDFNNRFDGIDQRFEIIDQRFDGIDQRLNGMDKRFEGFEDVVRHNGVLIEDVKREINLLSEGHGVLNGKIDRLDGRMDTFEYKLDAGFLNHEKRIAVLEAKA